MRPIALLLAIVGLAVLAAGAAFALGSRTPATPATGIVAQHRDVVRSVQSGTRGERSDVAMTEITVGYERADGTLATFTLDRAPELARRDFPVGAELPVFVIPDTGVASLTAPGADPLGFVLLGLGAMLAAAGGVVFVAAGTPRPAA